MYQIIKPTPDDFDELTCLWEASVRATHHFIPEAYIQKLKPLVWSVYLHSMPLYVNSTTCALTINNSGNNCLRPLTATLLILPFERPTTSKKQFVALTKSYLL